MRSCFRARSFCTTSMRDAIHRSYNLVAETTSMAITGRHPRRCSNDAARAHRMRGSSRSRWPHFRIHAFRHANHDVRKCLDVHEISVEIDDAGTQRVTTAYDRVGHEHLATSLQPVEQFAIERIEVLLG